MASVLTRNVLERALWTGAQALVGLGIAYLATIPMWWAAPIAVLLSAIKTNVIDHSQKSSSQTPTEGSTPWTDGGTEESPSS